MTDAHHDRQRTAGDGTGHPGVIERSEVGASPAPAHQGDDVELVGATCSCVESSDQFLDGFGSLYPGVEQGHVERMSREFDLTEEVGRCGAVGAGDQGNPKRDDRERQRGIGDEEAFGSQFGEELRTGQLELAQRVGGVDEAHDQLHAALTRVIGDRAANTDLGAIGHAGCAGLAKDGVDPLACRGEEGNRQGGLCVLAEFARIDQVEVDVSVGRALEARDDPSNPYLVGKGRVDRRLHLTTQLANRVAVVGDKAKVGAVRIHLWNGIGEPSPKTLSVVGNVGGQGRQWPWRSEPPLSDLTVDRSSELPFDPPLAPVIDLEPMINLAPGRRSDTAIDGVALSTVNPDSGRAHIMYVSENLAAMLGFRPDQILGRNPGALFAPSTPAAQLDAVARLVEQGKQATVRLELAHISGAGVLVQASFLQLPTMARGWPTFLAVYRDLSRGVSEEELLAEQSSLLDALARGQHISDVLPQVVERIERQVQGGSVWVALADGSGNLRAVAARHRVDLVEEVVELLDRRLLTQGGRASTPSYVRCADLPDALMVELRSQDLDSFWVYPLAGVGPQRRGVLVVAHRSRPGPSSSEDRVLTSMSRVLTVAVERSVTESSMAHQALHDALTQLPNRALIIDRLEQAVARLGRERARLAVLLVDVDRFKSLNDSWGPEVGDEVLVEVSRRLRRSVRLGDTVGRIGGDQFLVLCVANGDGDAEAMAERIVTAVGVPVLLSSGEDLHITSSVGLVVVDRPGHAPASIISNAELALARAVESGRGRYAVFEQGLQQRIVVRHEVEQALHVAITEDELVLHYQPLVEVSTGRMVGAEALIRWDRPGHGLLSPADFIEIAEDTGLIVPLGAWVVDEVCRQLSEWPVTVDGRRPVISINLSARQLADPALVSMILSAMDRHAVSTDDIGFEVTESMRVEDVEVASSTLKRLAALGCKLSIDDFGIGYATLDYLRRFSMADTIKIDRSFVDGLGKSREDTAIVTASLALAASLGLTVVAEGVETIKQYAELADLGCDLAQGYLLSRPVPIGEAHELWRRRQLILPPGTVRT